MGNVICARTDVGIKKKVNQDSVFAEEIQIDNEQAILAAVCDGMGGLTDGEKASALLTDALGQWFENSMAESAVKNSVEDTESVLSENFKFLVTKTGEEIAVAARGESGTTVCALLLAKGYYFTANVGDSRAYLLRGGVLRQLTVDHSVVQREIDAGRLTEAEALTHPARNVLLQCVGASAVIEPDFTSGVYEHGDLFIVCSDGFRRMVAKEEIADALYFDDAPDESDLGTALESLINACKGRGEKDNISAIAIYTGQDKGFTEGRFS